MIIGGLSYFDCHHKFQKIMLLANNIANNFSSQNHGEHQKKKKVLELVHPDICAHINMTFNRGKRYLIIFIDDYSKKKLRFISCRKSLRHL